MAHQVIYVRDCKCALCSCSCYGKNNPENIIKALKSVIEKNLKIKWDDFVSKLVALSCDRASVNTGQKGGVGALLKTEQPDRFDSFTCTLHDTPFGTFDKRCLEESTFVPKGS